MKRIVLGAVVIISISSCNKKMFVKPSEDFKAPRIAYHNTYETNPRVIESNVVEQKVYEFISNCKSFLGVPYKYGGTSIYGVDCSGLVYACFDALGEYIPRTSRDQAEYFQAVNPKDARKGDLIYFNTSGGNINHTGVITNINNGDIEFIHSSTSRGVVEESLSTEYWQTRFVKITRPEIFTLDKKKLFSFQ